MWFRSAGRLSGDADYSHALRRGVPSPTLFLHLHGKGCFRVGDTSWTAHEQTATILFPSAQPTSWSTAEAPWEFFWLTCGGDASTAYLAQFGIGADQLTRRLDIADFTRLDDLWQHLIASGRSIGIRTQLSFQRIAIDVLLNLLEAMMFSGEAEPDKRIYDKEVIHTVDSYLARPKPAPDRVDEVAGLFHSTPEHVSRVFKSAVGVPLKEYMINHRINQAKQLLAETALSVESVGAKIGYPEVYHFSRLFKNRVGVSPSVFRRNYWH